MQRRQSMMWENKRKVTNKDNNVTGNHLEVMFKFSLWESIIDELVGKEFIYLKITKLMLTHP